MATIRSLMQKDQNLTRLCIVFLAVFIICTVLKGTLFLSVNNFQSMGKQFPEFGLLAIAMAFTLYTAGIDLSVVAIANLSAVLVAKALPLLVTPETDAGTVTAIILCVFLLALLFGTLCGALNGLLIGGVGITPILATLGTQALFMGCAVVLTGGSTLGGLPCRSSSSPYSPLRLRLSWSARRSGTSCGCLARVSKHRRLQGSAMCGSISQTIC